MSAPSPSIADEWSPGWVSRATLVVAGVVAGFALVYVFRQVLFLLFVAVVVATALRPLIRALENRGATHGGAVGGVYTVLLTLTVGAVLLGGPIVLDQILSLATTAPEVYQRARTELLQVDSVLVNRIASRLPPQWMQAADEGKAVEEAIQQVTHTLGYVGLGLRGALALLAVMLLSYYWSLQEERTVRWSLLMAPPARREDVRELISAVQSKVGAYILGQGILCLAVGLLSLVAYLIIGLPYAVVLAVAAGLLEAVPYFGPVLGAVPAIVVAISVDPGKVLWVVGAVLVIQQVENHLLVPRVMDRSVGVNPVVTLLAIAGFGTLLGLAGAILAIPLAAVIQLLLDRFVLRREALEPPTIEGRDQASALRYQLQDLVYDLRLRTRHREEAVLSQREQIEELIESIASEINDSLERKQESQAGEAGSDLPANGRSTEERP